MAQREAAGFLFHVVVFWTLLFCLCGIIPTADTKGLKSTSKPRSTVKTLMESHEAAQKNSTSKGQSRGLNSFDAASASNSERRLRKRRKWSTSSPSGPSMSILVGKEGSLLKKIVTEVIAERDAQIAAALFEVAKNQPHLQMMVQTLGELNQSNQRLELSSNRVDDTQRRIDSRLHVIGEKMTLLESRLSQTERRIEREMSHIHGKMDDVFRNLPDKATDSLLRFVKQLNEQLSVIEKMLADASSATPSQIRTKNRHSSKARSENHLSPELDKLGNSVMQALSAAHNDLIRAVRESESNLDHQLSMLASDNGVFSCAISALMDRSATLFSSGTQAANAIQAADLFNVDSLVNNGTKCLLKCP